MFALDTTGSMSGLIDGAKRKIWSMADYIASGNPRPELRVGLVGYRDLGDDYVTRFYDLSDDMDTVFNHLQSFYAAGGGDTPEHVAKALADAVEKTSWTPGDKVLKIVYLVGDAPPHVDYHDGYDYAAIAREAAKKGIHVNTIRCGDDPDTARYWKQIAQLGNGDFSTIDQSGGVATIATPYDDKLAELNRRLAGTAIGYGRFREAVATKATAAAAAPATVAADRAGFAAKNGLAVSGEGDLIEGVMSGKVKLEALKPADLPPEIANAPAPAQAAFINEKNTERQQIIAEINAESAKRDSFMKHAKPAKKAAGFDDEVRSSIAKDAKSIGLAY